MSKRKRKGWSSLPWKPITPSLSSTTSLSNDESSKANDGSRYNHYDDPDADPSDLYEATSKSKSNTKSIDDTNAPGIFLGLEVVDGNQYTIQRNKKEGGPLTDVLAVERNKGATEDKEKGLEPIPSSSSTNETQEDSEEGDAEENTKVESDTEKKKRRKRERRKKAKIRKKMKKAEERKKLKKHKEEKKVPNQNSEGRPDNNESDCKEQEVSNEEKEEEEKQMLATQLTWSISAGGIQLHPTICRSLRALSFTQPTSIQAQTLPASMLGHRDVVGAAPTGSGKTLAYVLPILQFVLEERDKSNSVEGLRGLVLCPTRELAMQVSREFSKIGDKKNQQVKVKNSHPQRTERVDSRICGTIVGGLADVKQQRILDVVKPPVLVATPGRLWELMATKNHSHLNDLSLLHFLVIDEADRLVRKGCFTELEYIFNAIREANPLPGDSDSESDVEEDDDDLDRLKSLKGVRGEAKVTMLSDDILKMIEEQKKNTATPEPQKIDDDEFLEQQRLFEEDEGDHEDEDEDLLPTTVHRQTFIFSATLTLPPSSHWNLKSKQSSDQGEGITKGGKGKNQSTVEGAIAEILQKAGARGPTKIVDLSTSNNPTPEVKQSPTPSSTRSSVTLPPGLSLCQIQCSTMHKDSHLYAYLTTTKQGSSGPCLVFCNSVKAVIRVHDTLKVLGLSCRAIHAKMAQKARLSAIESLRESETSSQVGGRKLVVVVATDVAARGLDIPTVSTVVQYDVARALDTFVHRAGRTARGVGENAIGTSLSLVGPGEDRVHRKICDAILCQTRLKEVAMDSRLLSEAQERVSLASKIVSCEQVQSKASKQNKWFKDAASEVGFDLDDDMLDGGLTDGDSRDRQRLVEATKAKEELRVLLSRPMKKRRYGKFLLSSGTTAPQAGGPNDVLDGDEVDSFVIRPKGGGKKRKRRRKMTSK